MSAEETKENVLEESDAILAEYYSTSCSNPDDVVYVTDITLRTCETSTLLLPSLIYIAYKFSK